MTLESTAPSPVDRMIADLQRRGSIKWSLHPGTIGAAVAESDLGVAPAVRQAITAVGHDGHIGYLAPASAHAVVEAVSHWYHRSTGWSVDPGHVRLVPDVTTAFELVMTRLMRREAAVIVPTPAYRQFLALPALHGRRVIELPLVPDVHDRPRIDLDGLARAFALGGELLVLCTPHNPLGLVLDEAELNAIAAVVDAHGGRVFADEIHSPLVYAPKRHVPYAASSPVAAGHTVTATSASKGWNVPAIGCAQVVLTSATDRESWRSFGARAAHAVSSVGTAATVAAYTETTTWQAEVLARLDAIRHLTAGLVATRLPAARMRLPEAGYFAYLDLRSYELVGDTAAWLRDHARVSLSDGREGGAIGEGFARFVFATPEPVIFEAFDRLARALETR